MNLTLGTLLELKTHLLAESLREQTTWDGTLTRLGRGVAARFEKETNRLFARTVSDTYVCGADLRCLLLPRLPVEAITSIELRETLTAGWVDQGTLADFVDNWHPKSGVVTLPVELSRYPGAQLRATYTAGYWLDESLDGSVASERSFQQDSGVALSANAESLAITFATEFLEAPNVDVRIIPPGGGLIIEARASSITSGGFTALFGFPIPSTAYTLQWEASTSSATVAASEQPAGSTAVPDDLKLAWLLQCEAIWAKMDKNGLSMSPGVEANAASLAGLQLLPEVKEMLRAYTRHVLL